MSWPLERLLHVIAYICWRVLLQPLASRDFSQNPVILLATVTESEVKNIDAHRAMEEPAVRWDETWRRVTWWKFLFDYATQQAYKKLRTSESYHNITAQTTNAGKWWSKLTHCWEKLQRVSSTNMLHIPWSETSKALSDSQPIITF